jgi:hypothetical protein
MDSVGEGMGPVICADILKAVAKRIRKHTKILTNSLFSIKDIYKELIDDF